MSAPKPDDCVELVAVHRDGTVELWEGENIFPCSGPGGRIVVAETTKMGCLPIDPTTTRPLRRVFCVPCGRYFDGDDVSPQGIDDDEGQVQPFRKMVPDECVLRRGAGVGPARGLPLLRGAEGSYRVVVEFVPKGEKR